MVKVVRDRPESIAGVDFTRLIDVQGSEWNTSILEDVNGCLSHFKARWLKALQRYLKRSNSQMELENTYIYPLQRINDEHIMPK
eukprot:4684654-Ditylum_brightwellii.AAC.1